MGLARTGEDGYQRHHGTQYMEGQWAPNPTAVGRQISTHLLDQLISALLP